MVAPTQGVGGGAAVDETADYVWTGSHTFNGAVIFAGSVVSSVEISTPSILITSGSLPTISMRRGNSAPDEKLWDQIVTGATMLSRTRTDVGGNGAIWRTIVRSGTVVDSIAYAATVVSTSGLLVRNDTYGFIYVNGGSTAQASITTAVLVTGFASDGPSNDMTSAAASDKITVTRAGTYRVNFAISFTTSASSVVVQFTVYVNGSPTVIKCGRKIGNGADEGNCSCEGIVAIGAAQDVNVFVDADGSTDMTPMEMQLTLTRVGA